MRATNTNGRRSKLTDSEIIDLYINQNLKVAPIAKLAGIHRERINKLLIDNDIEIKGQRLYSLAIKDDTILKLYSKENKSIAYIAKEANCCEKTIRRRLTKYKIPIKSSAHKNGHHVKEHTLYILSNPNYPGWIKLGRTTNLSKRLCTYNTSSPFRDFKIDFNINTKSAPEIEWFLKHKYNTSHEWYQLSVKEAKNEILNYIKENE